MSLSVEILSFYSNPFTKYGNKGEWFDPLLLEAEEIGDIILRPLGASIEHANGLRYDVRQLITPMSWSVDDERNGGSRMAMAMLQNAISAHEYLLLGELRPYHRMFIAPQFRRHLGIPHQIVDTALCRTQLFTSFCVVPH
jgi:hypothetical protein